MSKELTVVEGGKKLSRAEVKERVARLKRNGDSRIRAEDKREAITLDPNGAVISILNQAFQADAVRVSIGSFCEGRQLKGSWSVRITAAELVPVE